jgi:hypothetical protein
MIGDRLTRIGEADLRGVGPFGFTARMNEQVGPDLQASVVFLRDGVLDTRMVSLHRFAFPWRTLPLSLGFATAAVAVLLRRPGVHVAQAFFLASMTYSLHWTFFAGGPRWQTYAWILVLSLSALAIQPLWLRFILLLPEELAPPGSRLPRWPWVFAVFGPSLTSRVFGVPGPLAFGLRTELAVTIAALATMLVLLTRNFRRAGPLGRRQLKWVVYGLYIGVTPVLVADIIVSLYPTLWWLHESSTIFIALIPLCFLIAIVRFNLFDVDRLISSTATYSILFMLCGAGVLTAVPSISAPLSTFAGIKHIVVQVTLSLFFAMVVLPGQRYLRPQIERFFFAQRYVLEQGIRELERDLAEPLPTTAILTMAGERLFALLQTENCVVYGKTKTEYLPIFVRGSVEPAPFVEVSPVTTVLQTRARAGNTERWRRMVRTSLNQTERTIVEDLRTAAVVALGPDNAPTAFICLGRKRSGDVYTSTDFALLTTLGQSITQAIEHSPIDRDC